MREVVRLELVAGAPTVREGVRREEELLETPREEELPEALRNEPPDKPPATFPRKELLREEPPGKVPLPLPRTEPVRCELCFCTCRVEGALCGEADELDLRL